MMVLKIKHFLLALKQFDGLRYSPPSVKLMATTAEPLHPEPATSWSASLPLPSPHMDSQVRDWNSGKNVDLQSLKPYS